MPDLIHMHIKCIKLFSKLLVIKEPQGLKVPDVTKLLGEFREQYSYPNLGPDHLESTILKITGKICVQSSTACYSQITAYYVGKQSIFACYFDNKQAQTIRALGAVNYVMQNRVGSGFQNFMLDQQTLLTQLPLNEYSTRTYNFCPLDPPLMRTQYSPASEKNI